MAATMCRWLAVAPLLLAACASAPIDGRNEVVGHYRMLEGPDIWDELDLMPNGLCTWWSCRFVGWLSRTPTPANWRVEHDQVVIETDPASTSVGARTTRLILRAWKGHVYLVPGHHLAWFDRYGPDEEFCFHADGTPLEAPPYRLPEPTPNSSR
jgi:hypothetical protein